jgi:hypothetical protein
MFAQLVMLSTIILLSLAGNKTLKTSQRINYFPGKMLSLGLFLVALGIFTYMVRDILTQFELYKFQLTIGKAGIFFHTLGGVLILHFLTQEFAPERFKKVFFSICLLSIVVVLIGLMSFPLVSEVTQAPFEPFPYKVIRHAPAGTPSNAVIFIFIFGPALLTSIVLYNTFKLKEKKLRAKGLLYGMGFLFLFLPSLVCLFVSPIYARWGYLIGAILLFKVLRMKV